MNEGLIQFLAQEDAKLRKVESELSENIARLVNHNDRLKVLECVDAQITLLNITRGQRKMLEKTFEELRKLKNKL